MAGQEMPPQKKRFVTCPECRTEMVITRITPILFGGRTRISRSRARLAAYEKTQDRAKLRMFSCLASTVGPPWSVAVCIELTTLRRSSAKRSNPLRWEKLGSARIVPSPHPGLNRPRPSGETAEVLTSGAGGRGNERPTFENLSPRTSCVCSKLLTWQKYTLLQLRASSLRYSGLSVQNQVQTLSSATRPQLLARARTFAQA